MMPSLPTTSMAPPPAHNDAGADQAAAERLSTNDALGALVWKAVESNRRHRGAHDPTGAERTVFTPVNVRGRLSPPMPEVFGNAVVLTTARMDVGRCVLLLPATPVAAAACSGVVPSSA